MTQTTLTDQAALAKEQSPPIKIDLAYALVMLGSPILWTTVESWLLYFYLPPEGKGIALVPAALYGAVIFATRALNAAVVTPIGYISDHTRSRWGRRLPFMAASALPLLIFFVLLWTPPIQGESIWNLVYLAVILALYNVTYSSLLIPYNALLPEIALADRHRIRITIWLYVFQMVGTVLASFAGLLVEHLGYAPMALAYACFALPLLYLPFLALRERPERQIPPTERMPFRQSIAITLRNPAFRVLIVAGTCYWVTTTFLMMAMPYIVTEICLLTTGDMPFFLIPAIVATLACYPLVMGLSNRLGKWPVLAGSVLASAVVLPGVALIGDWLPVPLIAQGIAWVILEATAMSGIMVLAPVFIAEVTDYDAQLTGQRREGAYYSAWGVLDQVINGVAAATLPLLLLLGHSRVDTQGPLGVRLIGPIGGVLLLAAFLIFLRYPLGRPKWVANAVGRLFGNG